ncbi:hypothetical protein M514_07251, partial [Trichuris suis]
GPGTTDFPLEPHRSVGRRQWTSHWSSNGKSIVSVPCRTVHRTPGRDSVRGNGQPMGPRLFKRCDMSV